VPVYEYECDRCGTFEMEQKISDPPLTACPHMARAAVRGGFESEPCDGTVRRLIAGSTGFVLNGKGWFKDGY
jgi:putative FmdB family regulatory protein